MTIKYLPEQFESKWVDKWNQKKIYKTGQPDKNKKKTYCLSMFPYPSGAGLHVGHVRIYTGTDVLARFFRMNGFTTLHPMGWDAFGLPAENAAIKEKKNPMDMVPENITNFKRQMKMIGFSYDWDKEFSTTDPQYYRWTQWLFIQFFKMGLLYKKNTDINFCPNCKTGLAEEEVLADGNHERCGCKIDKKELPQWIFKITAYADKLLKDLDELDWPAGILEMQRNWIGRKEGINIDYKVVNMEARHRVFSSTSPPLSGGSPKSLTQKQVSSLPVVDTITCFTTRPDTNFGATFIVLAPEHEFVGKIQNSKSAEIKKYVEKSLAKTDIERMTEGRKKTGVFTGFYAVNNLNGRLMPIWISDFVLKDVGTGAVVGVPGHDQRDFEFAQEFGLEVIRVVVGRDGDKSPITKKEQVQEEEGIMINSDFLNGLNIHVATKKVMDYLEEKGWGKRVVSYHLRDWIFSRQRYWGEPIPMVFCTNCAKNKISLFDADESTKILSRLNSSRLAGLKQKVSKNFVSSSENKFYGWFPVPDDQLPVKLPYVKSYEPTETGESPLAKIKDWVETACPECGEPARRETDTMPNWAGSCWYFLAFAFWSNEARHRVSHSSGSPSRLSTADIPSRSKQVSSPLSIENFKSQIKNSSWLPVDWYLGGAEHAVLHLLYARFWIKALQDLGLLNFSEPFLRLRNVGMVLAEDHRKMSKSFDNVINPDDVVSEFGADTLRMYEMFMAPFNQEIAWSTKALQGCYRFLKRVWEIYQTFNFQRSTLNEKRDEKLIIKLKKTIKKVTEDIRQTKFNTAIAAMMEFMNAFEKSVQVKSPSRVTRDKVQSLSAENAKKFLQILAPFAPFITEEIWQNIFNEKQSIHLSSWPKVEEKIIDEEITIPVQVDGKLRNTIRVKSPSFARASEGKQKSKIQSHIVELALKSEKVKKYLEGKKYKVIYIEGKILNFATFYTPPACRRDR